MIALHAAILLAQFFPAPGPRNAPTSTSTNNWITAVAVGSTRHDFDGAVGCQIVVGASPINMLSLGRYCVTGNSQTHTIWITNATSTGATLNSVTVNMAGCTGGAFVSAAITQTLAAGTTYAILSSETNGGDDFLQNDATFTTTAVIASFTTAFAFPPTPPTVGNTPGSPATSKMYGAVNFTY